MPECELQALNTETTDASLERLIDRAGRLRVFGIVLAAGWRVGDSIPHYVWAEAARLASRIDERRPAR